MKAVKMKRYWWVSRDDADGRTHDVWPRKPVAGKYGFYYRDRCMYPMTAGEFETQTGIVLKPGECRRIENPFWRKAAATSSKCLRCGRRLALGSVNGFRIDPDQEPYEDGKVEPVLVYGREQYEFETIQTLSVHFCPRCENVVDVTLEPGP